MFLALLMFFAIEITGLGALNQGFSPPDVRGFTPVLSKELEFRIDDYKTAFVGRMVVYQNPNDLNEFVKVYYRQVVIVSERSKEKNTSENGGRDRNLSNSNYHLKQESEAINRVQRASDAFAFVQWRTIRDPRTGRNIRDGFLKSWLLEQNGSWTFSSSHNLFTAPFSEPSRDNPRKRINVGIQFNLVGGTHLVRVDQDDILTPAKEAANENK